MIQILRPISPLAWIPLAIVWFGVGNFAAIFLIFLASFFPVVVSTIEGGAQHARHISAGRKQFRSVASRYSWTSYFPAALPQILIGYDLARDSLAGGGCS